MCFNLDPGSRSYFQRKQRTLKNITPTLFFSHMIVSQSNSRKHLNIIVVSTNTLMES